MKNIFELLRSSDDKGVDEYIKSGQDLNIQNKNGWTPLIIAIIRGERTIAFKLIDAGCDLDIKGKYGSTALIHACGECFGKEIALKLIESDCNLDFQAGSGLTALAVACMHKKKKIIFKLIEAGCNLKPGRKSSFTYKFYINKFIEPTIEKAFRARYFKMKLFNLGIKYVRQNRNLFKEKDLMGLNKDIRCYFIKN